jgi:hypothetical protein
MINVKSYLDDLEIIYSSQVHCTLNKLLKISFSDVKVEIKYVNDTSLPVKIDWKIEDSTLKIEFQNYTSPLGSGITTPWRIGSYDGKELFITIYSVSLEHGKDLIVICNYVFYTGKEVENEPV